MYLCVHIPTITYVYVHEQMYPTPPNAETAGRTEEIVGTWLEKQDREKIYVATKVCGYWKDNWLPGNRLVPKVRRRLGLTLRYSAELEERGREKTKGIGG